MKIVLSVHFTATGGRRGVTHATSAAFSGRSGPGSSVALVMRDITTLRLGRYRAAVERALYQRALELLAAWRDGVLAQEAATLAANPDAARWQTFLLAASLCVVPEAPAMLFSVGTNGHAGARGRRYGNIYERGYGRKGAASPSPPKVPTSDYDASLSGYYARPVAYPLYRQLQAELPRIVRLAIHRAGKGYVR